MGDSDLIKQPDRASLERQRFLLNYERLAGVRGEDDWFRANVGVLVKIATQDDSPAQPWQNGPAITPIVVPAPLARRGSPLRTNMLRASLDRLGDIYNQVEPVALSA